MTGNRPTPVLQYPMYGSVVSREVPAAEDLPSFVSIDRPVEGPGYLGPEYGPLSTGEKPRHGQPFRVRGITLGDGLTVDKYRARLPVLAATEAVSLCEGNTPLIPLDALLGREHRDVHLFAKFEG